MSNDIGQSANTGKDIAGKGGKAGKTAVKKSAKAVKKTANAIRRGLSPFQKVKIIFVAILLFLLLIAQIFGGSNVTTNQNVTYYTPLNEEEPNRPETEEAVTRSEEDPYDAQEQTAKLVEIIRDAKQDEHDRKVTREAITAMLTGTDVKDVVATSYAAGTTPQEKAVNWAIMIANDDSFTYGSDPGPNDAEHSYGCYFCGTNKRKYERASNKTEMWYKTYCCNPFVHAAYAHGAGDPACLKACQKGQGGGTAAWTWTRYGSFKDLGHCRDVPFESLELGDIIVVSYSSGGHAWLYAGGDELVEASGGGWGANSIIHRKTGARSRYESYQRAAKSAVVRYTGPGGAGTLIETSFTDKKISLEASIAATRDETSIGIMSLYAATGTGTITNLTAYKKYTCLDTISYSDVTLVGSTAHGAQSMAYMGNGEYAVCLGRDNNNYIYKMNGSKLIKKSSLLRLGHGNGLTYNPSTKLLYSVRGVINADKAITIDPDTLEIKDTIKFKSSLGNAGAISYDWTSGIFTTGSGYNIRVLNSDLTDIQRKISKVRTGTPQDQGAGFGVIYNISSFLGGENINMYQESNGNYVGSYKVALGGEVESCDIDENGNIYILLHSGNVYRTKSALALKAQAPGVADGNASGTQKVIDSAIEWAKMIANDDSWGYGKGYGGYFTCPYCAGCTSKTDKKYVCMPFIAAAYAHGGDPVMMSSGGEKGVHKMHLNNRNFEGEYGTIWKKVGLCKDLTISDLKPGDVLIQWDKNDQLGHACMYIGDDDLVEAADVSPGIVISKGAAGSRLKAYGKDGWKKDYNYVMRYVGQGGGDASVSAEQAVKSSDAFKGISTKINAKIIWAYFRKQGFSEQAAAAILGNFRVESGSSELNPASREGNSKAEPVESTALNYSKGIGIAQWTKARGRNLVRFAKQNNGNWYDLMMQLKFISKELDDGYIRDLEAFRKIKDIEEAVEFWCSEYEKPGAANLEKRTEYAKEYYEKFKGVKVDDINLDVSGYTSGEVGITRSDFEILSAFSLSLGNGQLIKSDDYTLLDAILDLESYEDMKGNKVKLYWTGENKGKVNYEKNLEERVKDIEYKDGFFELTYVKDEDGNAELSSFEQPKYDTNGNYIGTETIYYVTPILRDRKIEEYSKDIFGLDPEEDYVNGSEGFTNLEAIKETAETTIQLYFDGQVDPDVIATGGIAAGLSNLGAGSAPTFNKTVWLEKNVYGSGDLLGQCTWFAWARFYEIYGFSPGFTGNGSTCARECVSANPTKFKLQQGGTPVAGSVFSMTNCGVYGHTGIVVAVSGNTVTIQEGNWGSVNWNYPYKAPPGGTKEGRLFSCGWQQRTLSVSELNAYGTEYAVPVVGAMTSSDAA